MLIQDFLVPFQNTSSPSPFVICMILKLFLFFLVAFLGAWTLLSFSLKSNSLWVRQSWRRSCCCSLNFVLCVQDTFVNGGILLAPCYVESTRAVLTVGLSMKIWLDLCWHHLPVHSRLGITVWPIGQDFARGEKSQSSRDSCASGECGVSRKDKIPTSVLQDVFFLAVSGGGAGNVFWLF